MDKVNGKLTVYFEEPFWIGVFERIEDGKLSVAKVTFGAEPKDYLLFRLEICLQCQLFQTNLGVILSLQSE